MRWASCLLVAVSVLSAGCGMRSELRSARVVRAAETIPVHDIPPAAVTVTPPPASLRPPAARPAARPKPAAPPAVQTLAFCPREGYTPLMDLHRPAGTAQAPVVLFVHGGAFISGSRREGFFVDTLLPALVSRGFAVASIEYRLAPHHPWPAQIEDVKCAVRFLRATGAERGIDPARIGAWGESAGGHLVAMLAGNRTAFETGQYLDRSSQVQAVLDVAGPADLEAPDWPSGSVAWIRTVFGEERERLREASPVSHVAREVPFLLVHGTRDDVVPYTQSLALAQRLRMAGAETTMLTVEGAGHDPRAEAGMRPSLAELVSIAVEFFATRLAPA